MTNRRLPPRKRLPHLVSGRSLGAWGWATALGAIGLCSALRGLHPVLAGTAPTWYEPTLAALGLSGMGVAATALVSTRHRLLPWVMLGLATVPFGLNLGLTIGLA